MKTAALFPEDQPPSILIYFGEGSDEALDRVRGQLPGRSTLCWVVPPGTDLNALLARQDARTVLCASDRLDILAGEVDRVIERAARRDVRLVIEQGFQARYPEVCRSLVGTIKAALDRAGMEAGRGLIFLRSCLLNLALIAERSVSSLPGVAPVGADALVCAAGPSLREQLPLIAALADRVVLVAVGHALPTLLRAGIRPDVAVEDDAVAGVNWPEDLDVSDILLVAAATVDHRVGQRFDHICWCEGSSPAFNDLMRQAGSPLERMTIMKTVSTHALDVAVRMRCRRIALVGQDLCLGPDGQLHADGKRQVNNSERLTRIPGNEGGEVTSTRDFLELRDAVERYFSCVEHTFAGRPDAPVFFNCTRGGARIAGIERMTLEQFEAEVPLERVEVHRPGAGPRPAVRALAASFEASVQEALSPEASPEASPPGGWQDLVARHLRRLVDEAPGLPVNWADPFRRELLHDLLGDVRMVREALDGPASAGCERRPEAFASFSFLGEQMIGRTNPNLAQWLAAHRDAPCPARFRFRWKNQVLPVMDVQPLAGGRYVSVGGEWSMLDEAADEMARFVRENDERGSVWGVLLVAPCNWVHALALLKQRPHVPMIVIEPWIESLALQCRHGCFLHRLPPGTLVLTCDRRVEGQDALFGEALARWRREGIRPVRFSPACVADWPELSSALPVD